MSIKVNMFDPLNHQIAENAAQDIRHLFCDKSDEANHVCVGSMLVDKDGMCLSCPLCGICDKRKDRHIINANLKTKFILVSIGEIKGTSE